MELLNDIILLYILGAMINFMWSIINVFHRSMWRMSWKEFFFYPYYWINDMAYYWREVLRDGE